MESPDKAHLKDRAPDPIVIGIGCDKDRGEPAAGRSPEVCKLPGTSSITQSVLNGEINFCTFTVFFMIAFLFATYIDAVLIVVSFRAIAKKEGNFGRLVSSMNLVWIMCQVLLMADLAYTYWPSRAGIERIRSRQPQSWKLLSGFLGINIEARGFLLLLSLLLPLNALLFYDGLGGPVLSKSVLDGHVFNSPSAWETAMHSGSAVVDMDSWTVLQVNWETLSLPLKILTTECYPYDSGEYHLLGLLQHDEMPKQAYCETLLGTMMAGWREDAGGADWQQDEDVWDESFEFALRLFTSLAGIVADQSETEGGLRTGFWFMRDVTDVFDMFMMTSVDVVQMHEGRPLLSGSGLNGTIFRWIWVGMGTVFLRAVASVGFTPITWGFRRCFGERLNSDVARRVIDTTCSLVFIELPYLILRFSAWWSFRVPVSLMAVKNVLGVYEDLHIMGLIGGFSKDGEPRGIWAMLKPKQLPRPR